MGAFGGSLPHSRRRHEPPSAREECTLNVIQSWCCGAHACKTAVPFRSSWRLCSWRLPCGLVRYLAWPGCWTTPFACEQGQGNRGSRRWLPGNPLISSQQSGQLHPSHRCSAMTQAEVHRAGSWPAESLPLLSFPCSPDLGTNMSGLLWRVQIPQGHEHRGSHYGHLHGKYACVLQRGVGVWTSGE